MTMEPVLRILGPVTLSTGSAGPAKQRALLAALTMAAGRPVPADELIWRIWDDVPPPSAYGSLYALVARLRKALLAGRTGVIIRTSGYALELSSAGSDLMAFRSLRDRARVSALPLRERAALLGRALAFWTGPPLGGVPGCWAERARAGLRAEEMETLIAWARLEVSLGQTDVAIGRLRDSIEQFPLVEPLVEVQMLALHGAGRDSEALQYYEAMRIRLADELGTRPGQKLQEVHARLLRDELDVHRP